MDEDLVRWLGKQLDEDTTRATTAAEELGADWDYDDGFVLARREGDMVATGSQDFLEAERGRFIAEHDPARVLREIEAKRKLLTEYAESEEALGSFPDMVDVGRVEGLRVAVAHAALPYANRPGWDERWRP